MLNDVLTFLVYSLGMGFPLIVTSVLIAFGIYLIYCNYVYLA